MAEGFFDVERRTELWMNLPQETLSRRPWFHQRSARHIRPQRVTYNAIGGGLFNSGKTFFTGDAWIMQPYGQEPTELLTTEGQSHVTADQVNLASNHRAYDTFRQTTVAGAGQAGNLISSGAPAFQRRRQAGSLLSEGNLDEDAAARPSPDDAPTPPLIPNDRVISGTVSYPANQPFLLKFLCVNHGAQEDVATFHFGGEAPVSPSSKSGGQFCVRLKSSGRAILCEFDQNASEGDPWRKIWEFPWKHAHSAGDFTGVLENNTLFIVPYGRDHIAFYNLGAGYAGTNPGAGFLLFGLQDLTAALALTVAQDAVLGVPVRLFRHAKAQDGHQHLSFMTGPGIIRMDGTRTNRAPFQIAAPGYRTDEQGGGYLYDAPFLIDTDTLPLATHISLVVDGWFPSGTSITPTIYDADTNVELLRSGLVWLTNANQRRYYVGFQFSAGDTGEQTPVLWGYSVYVSPQTAVLETTPVRTGRLKSVNVTGPGVTAQEETAGVTVEDEVEEAALLRTRDQMRCKLVVVRRDDSVPLSVIFEGQTASPEAMLKGVQDGELYPSANWTEYDGRMVGLYPRLWRQYHMGAPFSFASSNDSPNPLPLPSTDTLDAYEPWALTDILTWALQQAGVPAGEIDVPFSPLRLPPSSNSADDYAIQAGTAYGKFIETLPRDYMGRIFLRDPNCGALDSSGVPTGMWRLLPNPVLNSNFLLMIDLDAPPYSAVPYFVMAEGAYGANVWPVLKDTWHSHPKAPEAHGVVCKGPRAGDADDGPKLLVTPPLVNPKTFDPSSADYLEGDRVLITRVFETFTCTMPMLKVAARIIYAAACFAEAWFECVIPLVLVVDPLDPQQRLPRPLRINDQILIKRFGVTYPAIVRSGNPIYDHDDYPKIQVEGRFLNFGDLLNFVDLG